MLNCVALFSLPFAVSATAFSAIRPTDFIDGVVKVNDFPPGIDGVLYGYPDGKIGGLIVEGPFPYKHGPAVWDDGKNPWVRMV